MLHDCLQLICSRRVCVTCRLAHKRHKLSAHMRDLQSESYFYYFLPSASPKQVTLKDTHTPISTSYYKFEMIMSPETPANATMATLTNAYPISSFVATILDQLRIAFLELLTFIGELLMLLGYALVWVCTRKVEDMDQPCTCLSLPHTPRAFLDRS